MFVLGRDIVYDRSTACARDVSCEKTFSQEIAKYPSNVPFVLKTEAQIISTVLQYHSSLETAGNLKPVLDSSYPCSTPHSSVFYLAMQLVICGECLNYEW